MDNTHRYINFHRCKSSTSCPVCGSEIPNNALFCETCGMRIHSHQSHKSILKVNLRSTYYFYNEINYQNTKHIIYNGNRAVYDKLNWYGKWGYYETDGWSYYDNESLADYDKDEYLWRVDINDNLTPNELDWVVGHIREHRGLYYQR